MAIDQFTGAVFSALLPEQDFAPFFDEQHAFAALPEQQAFALPEAGAALASAE